MNTTPYIRLRRLSTLIAVSILTLFTLSGVTGILLAFYYDPAAGEAYNSLQNIVENVSSGWLIYSIHNLAGNGIITLAMVQMVILFLGRQFNRHWWLSWISGGLLLLNLMGLGWTSMILGWNQEGFWRLKIELGQISGIPVVGETLARILTGGVGIGTATIQHLYTLHSYVLALTALGLAVTHLTVLIRQQQDDRLFVLDKLEKLVQGSELSEEAASETATSEEREKVTSAS
ncbi:Cytochrome bc complex cytochrome b subunit [Acaryochloris thomasi RCC1774]|uniref:Cytochrome bc complex cytochrome b subunit n=1 Tax=Acaryochloris thomasi RCC1774 TaxID=1764569 RepID=A0A2W1JLV3_9CYAN|nr:cytochrome b N-terminal domain-containing protein [Acaryochloris thomasi]PZD74298.1 Cytochrome bc complex cytochrome b subunit [Acaryochloris thomasi RCC1774]